MFGSVCSGIEAASVAWHPLGWRAAWCAEIEPFPSAVLAARWPGVPNLGDFTRIGKGVDVEPVELLVGGTPCQSFSVAGKRLGLDDPRGNLTLEFIALAGRLRPRWVVWENVPGVLSDDGGRTFGAVLGLLGQLGYGLAYRILDAQFFGVAQRRRRVFVVGHLGAWQRAAAVLLEPSCLRGDSPPRREARERVAASLTHGVESGGRGGYSGRRREDDENLIPEGGALIAYGGNRKSGPIEIAAAVNAHGGPHGRLDFESETLVMQCRSNVGEMGTLRSGNGNETGGVPFTLALRGRGDSHELEYRQDGTANAILTPNGGRGGIGGGAVAAPITSASAKTIDSSGSNGVGPVNAIIEHLAVRRLTPRECERLQGFPDDYTLIEHRGKPAADGPRYRALGNSMAVPCMAWIGKRIAMVDAVREVL